MREAVIAALMTWAANASGLPEPAEPPLVITMPPAVIAEYRPYGGALGSANAAGLYFPGTGIIYVDETLPANARGLATLIHEIVHYLQDSAGLYVGCSLPLEIVAYQVQAEFLAGNGILWNPGPLLDDIGATTPGACNPKED